MKMSEKVKHLIMFSGGAMSWAAAKRVADQHGTEGMILLFADTKIEDEDLYRFLGEAAENIGAPLVKIADGRTPWEVFRDQRIIGNPRMSPCSRDLKKRLLDRWRTKNMDPKSAVIYVGLDWTEIHRLKALQKISGRWRYEAPMTERPLMTKADILDWMRKEGLRPPRLYTLGFPHNNCGGFCIKAGQAQFAHLFRVMPERYRHHEEQEESLRQIVGDHSILRDRTGGSIKVLTLRQLRERIEAKESYDAHDWGGCGCAVE